MLEPEITPFATAHRNALDKIIAQMQSPTTHDPDNVTYPVETVLEWVEKLRTAKRGFDRFEVCALGEWKQKVRYEKYAKQHGYPYS